MLGMQNLFSMNALQRWESRGHCIWRGMRPPPSVEGLFWVEYQGVSSSIRECGTAEEPEYAIVSDQCVVADCGAASRADQASCILGALRVGYR